ncbi:putative wsc4-like protein [Diplodia seriata]|uniref:Putative wsc4-like protein n=1 Tax=Diplodia seriata TaxID=420778 RepID=A0A0G2EM15_9PEZI|nr:putative wsc4-like protein [Diplodia seriata]
MIARRLFHAQRLLLLLTTLTLINRVSALTQTYCSSQNTGSDNLQDTYTFQSNGHCHDKRVDRCEHIHGGFDFHEDFIHLDVGIIHQLCRRYYLIVKFVKLLGGIELLIVYSDFNPGHSSLALIAGGIVFFLMRMRPRQSSDPSDAMTPNSERRNSRPLFYDQRLNPQPFMNLDNGSHGSIVSIEDNRDYTRTLNVRNPDPPERQSRDSW